MLECSYRRNLFHNLKSSKEKCPSRFLIITSNFSPSVVHFHNLTKATKVQLRDKITIINPMMH
jgi:hypothetical protein